MIKFLNDNGTVRVLNVEDNFINDKLRPAVYGVRFHKMMGFYLEEMFDKFKLPKKIYGKAKQKANKIIKSYGLQEKSLGVLLTGDKGSGKSLLSQIIANKAIKQGIPTIIISDSFTSPEFFSFVNMLGDCVVIFDEFAKTFVDEEGTKIQDRLLTYFDGAESNGVKRLNLVMENEVYDIDRFLLERPGRLHYHLEYKKVEEDVIEEYLKDNLKNKNKKFINDVIIYARSSTTFSIDILDAICKEKNNFNEELSDIVADLNVPNKTSSEFKLIKLTNNKTNKDIPEKYLTTKMYQMYYYVGIGDLIDKSYPKYKETIETSSGGGDFDSTIIYQEGNLYVLDLGDFTAVFREDTKLPKEFTNIF